MRHERLVHSTRAVIARAIYRTSESLVCRLGGKQAAAFPTVTCSVGTHEDETWAFCATQWAWKFAAASMTRPTEPQSHHPPAVSPYILDRNFASDGPDRKWPCEITYIPTDDDFHYLAGVMDPWSRGYRRLGHVSDAECVGRERRVADGDPSPPSAAWASPSRWPVSAVREPREPIDPD